MARKQPKTAPKVALTPRKVKFNVKATPVVRKARADLMKAIVACKGREADLEGMIDTMEVLTEFLEARGKRDYELRTVRAQAALAAAKAAQATLDNQRVVTAEHDVAQAERGLAAAQGKLDALK